jgi:hypothetical protein
VHTVTFDQPVSLESVSARVGEMAREVYLNVTGTHNNGNGTNKYMGVISTRLTTHALNFKHKITVVTFSLKGKATTLVLDDFDFGYKHSANAGAGVINTKMGFEELLEHKDVYKLLAGGKRVAIQKLNDEYDLYPGIYFSHDLILGYDADANPGLGGQVYLYSYVGSKSYIRFT